ncbi:Uncharacterised protein [Serratia proteamaculans]|uniref:Fimbrial adhesin MrpH C-terminal domain-containing protein n=1 Tax=Serratia proteamaculans TaxID=28151 RepID=A0ABS0TQF0_SERPR|nr:MULTISPECIES: hypothetical protein [Serratia]KAB1493898.1 hypothetical protein F8R23_21775 [Serratia proteamaculans]MBI6180585.1 hypothetical protein [Serratia proteamaculans]CAI1078238.1 Uncharacterised protein [Serratia proteamaculans]CAI1103202.1 Uncharacterised protein [Serratia proteamaculans]CAI2515915.1 Uncharacterised protein [Serratia proteamaculans]
MRRIIFCLTIIFCHQAYSFVNANVTVDWQLAQGGEVLRFNILSVDPIRNDSIFDCGGILSKPKCQIMIARGGRFTPPYNVFLPLKGKQTFTTLIDTWSKSLPASGAIADWGKWVKENNGKAPCIVFDAVSDGNYGESFASSCNGTVTPPPVDPPEPPVSCYLNGNIYLQHGTLAADNVTGDKTDTVANLYCTRAAKVKLQALASLGGNSNVVNLRADGSLKSSLSVGGYAGNDGVLLDVPGTGGKAVTFSSVLISNGALVPGSFTGSGVAVLDIL